MICQDAGGVFLRAVFLVGGSGGALGWAAVGAAGVAVGAAAAEAGFADAADLEVGAAVGAAV